MRLKLSDETYDFLNSFVRYVLPAFGTLYFTLAAIWELPYADEVVRTIIALATFFGLVIALARKDWKADGSLVVDDDAELHTFGFDDDVRLEDLKDNQIVTLKVRHSKAYPDGLPYSEDE